jgi:hypothetical protein
MEMERRVQLSSTFVVWFLLTRVPDGQAQADKQRAAWKGSVACLSSVSDGGHVLVAFFLVCQ